MKRDTIEPIIKELRPQVRCWLISVGISKY